jgi:hypothetical protein
MVSNYPEGDSDRICLFFCGENVWDSHILSTSGWLISTRIACHQAILLITLGGGLPTGRWFHFLHAFQMLEWSGMI